MSRFSLRFIILTVALGTFANESSAQQPPDVVESSSDGLENTAMGTGALFALTTGYYNTAAGNSALRYNTTGYSNTAVGDAMRWCRTRLETPTRLPV